MNFLPLRNAAMPVVPEPQKGSRTVPSGGQPASIHLSTRLRGN
jgi:hypothetical protein